MPGITPVLGRTEAEARERYEELQALLPDDLALQSMSHICGGLDLSKFPLDGPLPELPPSNAAKARQALVVRTAREQNMTLRQIARHTAAAMGHRVLVGTAEYIADELEAWLAQDAADGFNVICNYYPGPLEDFCRLVVPELQRRGVFRANTRGARCATIWVLPVPENRYTCGSGDGRSRRHSADAIPGGSEWMVPCGMIAFEWWRGLTRLTSRSGDQPKHRTDTD